MRALRPSRISGRLTIAAVLLALLPALASASLAAQSISPSQDRETPDSSKTERVDWNGLSEELNWEDDFLVSAEEIDVSPLDALHSSEIFAAGVDRFTTSGPSGQALKQAKADYASIGQLKLTLEREVENLHHQIADQQEAIRQIDSAIGAEIAAEQELQERIDLLEEAIAEIALRIFIGGDDTDPVIGTTQTDERSERVVSDEVVDHHLREIEEKKVEQEQHRAERQRLEQERGEAQSALDDLRNTRVDYLGHIETFEQALRDTEDDYSNALHGQLEELIDGTDVTLVAMNAYVISARRVQIERPECGITWSMLAGIGKIESLHGQIGASSLDADGNTTNPITGPALDGRVLGGEPAETEGTDAAPPKSLALIRDSDGGLFDGDTVYDRAVGPMQFIPQTWSRYQSDGNLDGESDPQSVYDAALASARYLCTASSMQTVEGQTRAYLAYNRDVEYGQTVIANASRYEQVLNLRAEDSSQVPWFGLADGGATRSARDVGQTPLGPIAR